MLSVNGNDAISTQARNNLNAFGQSIEANPNDVLTLSFGQMAAPTLKTLGDTAAMGNHGYTMKGLAKAIFANDVAAVQQMTSTLGYITKAQHAIVEMAFVSQYHGQMKTKLRDDVVEKYGQAMANAGMVAGVAAAQAQAKAAPKAKAAA